MNLEHSETFFDFFLVLQTDQTITAAWDKKLKCWDARLSTPIGCLSDLDIEVDSMTLSGFSLMVAVRSSVYIYDLRSFRDSVESKESYMDVPLKCVRSIASVEGDASSLCWHLFEIAF